MSWLAGAIMVKPRRKKIDSDGVKKTEDTKSYKSVFIDTNLDTHLALLVSYSDTVSDLIKKFVFEHLRCFPKMRKLKISSVKVKRKGHYYHLPDTMLVSSVFEATKNDWFLSVDVSRFQCLGNDQRLVRLTYPQTKTENGSFNAMNKQKVFYTTEAYRAHGNLAYSSIMKQMEVTKVIGELKSVKPTDNSQELSHRSGPVAKKRKMNHKEDVVNLPVTDTSTSKHGIDNDSEFKIVGNDTTSTNSNEGERENISMKLVDASAEPVRIQCSDPSKVSKQGMKKSKMGGVSAEISGVQDDTDTLDEISQSGTVANKLNILGSKESRRSSTEFNHRDILKTTIQENSTAGKPIKEALAEILGDQSVRTDTTHKKRNKKMKTKKGKNSSMCRDDPAYMVLGSTDEGTRGLEEKEGVEVKIFDKLTDVESTIHVAQSRPKGTSPVEEHASNKECPAPVSKEFYEMNLVGRPIVESNVSGDNELRTDVANTTGEPELIPNHNLKMPMSEKLGDASTTGPLPSYQLGDLQDMAENSFGRKRSRAKKSTFHQELDGKNVIEASQNAHASDRDIVRNDGSNAATTKVGSIMPKTDVDHVNGIVKEGTDTFLPSDNNESMAETKEQVLSAKSILEDKANIESGNVSSMKRKKRSRRKSSEKITDKLDGEDDSRVNCPSLAAVIGSITDALTERSKKGEGLFHAEMLQIGLNTEVKGSSHNKDLVQVQSATCRSLYYAKAEMTIKEVETMSTAPSDEKIAEGHGNSGRSKKKKTKKEVSVYSNDVSCAPSAMDEPPANHFVQGSNQDKNALPASKTKGASEKVSKSAYAAGSHQQQVEKATIIMPELLPDEEKGNEVEHLLLNQTDKNQETVSIVEKRLKTKTRRRQISKKSESILSIQDQEVGHKDLAASNDNLGDVNPLPERMEMDESGRNSHVDQLAGTKLENQKNSGIHSNFESSRNDVRNTDSFRVPSHTLTDGVLEEMDKPDVNTDKGEGINFKQYFVPGQQGEVASNKPTKSNRDTKSGRKLDDGMTSRGTSTGVSNSRIEVSVPSRSSAQGDKSLEEVGKLATFDAPAYKKKSKESVDESKSSSSSKGSDRFPEHNRRKTGSEIQSSATRNTKMRTGDIEDFTQPKKGLLNKPGAKSGDSRLRRSDSKGGGNSDSTTETPSDYSSSSDNSIEGSEISQASIPKGANVAKSNDDGAKHKLKSNFLGQDITMDMILRSSSRFKKAKVMAAQCQDEESQPVDVVPDSLADTQNQ